VRQDKRAVAVVQRPPRQVVGLKMLAAPKQRGELVE